MLPRRSSLSPRYLFHAGLVTSPRFAGPPSAGGQAPSRGKPRFTPTALRHRWRLTHTV